MQFYRVKLIQQILELKALQSIEIFIDFLNTKSYKLKNHFNTIQTPSHSASAVLGQPELWCPVSRAWTHTALFRSAWCRNSEVKSGIDQVQNKKLIVLSLYGRTDWLLYRFKSVLLLLTIAHENHHQLNTRVRVIMLLWCWCPSCLGMDVSWR